MLDLGFIHALKQIVRLLPAKRQTLFFSATMPKAIKELADKYPHRSGPGLGRARRDHGRAGRPICHLRPAEREAGAADDDAARRLFGERGNMDRVLIFTRTKHGADRVVKLLGQSGIPANAIHGNKSQPQRERALAEFKGGRAKILVATDIAARGIDVTGVSHVINFELPNVSEQYVHRIGRTARAGAAGIAIAYCAPDERAYLKGIEKLTRQQIEMVPLPANFIAEADRIKATRGPSPEPSRQERRDEERARAPLPPAPRPSRPGPLSPRAVKPMGDSRRRAAGR